MFSLTLRLVRREWGGVSRIAIHVTFRQIRDLRALWASDLPSEPPFSLSRSLSLSPSFHSAFTPSVSPLSLLLT